MKLTRRFLALLLALSMSLSMVTPAFASETEAEPETEAVVEENGVEVLDVEAEEVQEPEETLAPVVLEAASADAVMADVAEGSEGNPYVPEYTGDTVYTATVTVPAGTAPYYFEVPYTGTVTATYFNGTANGYPVEVEGTEDVPAICSFNTAFEMEVAYTVTVTTGEVGEEPAAGTQENPAYPEWEWNEAGTGASFTVTIPAGESYYFYVMFGGMEMTVNGGEAVVVNGGRYNPELHYITNDGADAQEYTVTVAEIPALPGTVDNPAELTDAGATVELAAASQGHYFIYTAPSDGIVSFQFSAEDADGNAMGWMYFVNNLTAYKYGDTQWSDSDPVVNPAEIAVNAGDELQIMVNTYDPADEWNAPEGSVTVAVSFEYPAGTEQNPITEFYMGMGTISGEAAAGATVYYSIYNVGGMTMTIADAADLTVTVDGVQYNAVDGVISVDLPAVMDGRMPVSFSVTNNGTNAAAYSMAFAYAAGSANNPAALVLGKTRIGLEAGSQGYFYTWTAPMAGTFYLTMNTESGWTYVVNNVTSNNYGEIQWSDSDPVMTTYSVPVDEGDEVQLMVNTYDAANPFGAPAGTIEFTTEFVRVGLSEEDPMFIAEDTLTDACAVGATMYYTGRIGGKILNIENAANLMVYVDGIEVSADENGVICYEIPKPQFFGAQSITITNNGDTDAEYTLVFTYPVGSVDNPEAMTDDSASAKLEPYTEGWYFEYTAAQRGDLTVSVSAANAEGTEMGWEYVVEIPERSFSTDKHWSDDEVVVSSETVSVKPGDKVRIYVNTYFAGTATVEAGTVTVTTSLAANSSENPIVINDISVPVSGDAVNGETVYYKYYAMNPMVLTIEDAAGLTVSVTEIDNWGYVTGTTDYEADEETGTVTAQMPASRMGAIFSVTNNSGEDAEYTMSFGYPVGSMNNPAVLDEAGTVTFDLEADSQGYFYTYTAPERGEVYVEISAADSEGTEAGWLYRVNNVTKGIYGDKHQSDDDPVVNPETVAVNKGDQIEITVAPYMAMDTTVVTLTVSFEEAAGVSSENPIYTRCNEDGIVSGVNPGNTDVYYSIGGVSGANLTIENASGLTATITYWDNNTWQEVSETFTPDENGVISLKVPEIGDWSELALVISNTNEDETAYDLVFTYDPGHSNNPAELILGETTVTRGEGDSNYYFNWTAPEDGYFTITMNSENWFYTVGNLTTGKQSDWMYSDSAAPSTTLYVNEGDLIEIQVNTYDPYSWSGSPAGEVTFTAELSPATYEIASGKKLTLSFKNPTTGKKVSGSKVKWAISEVYVYDPDGNAVAYENASAYATLKNGVLTTKKCGDRVHMIITASLKSDASVTATYYVDILPAATKLSIWAMDSWTGGYDYPVLSGDLYLMDLRAENRAPLLVTANTYPNLARDDIKWSASSKLVKFVYNEDGSVEIVPSGTKTGTVTITAAAKDGSGKKASFKVKLVKFAQWVEVYDKSGNKLPDKIDWYETEYTVDENGNRVPTGEIVYEIDWSKTPYVWDEELGMVPVGDVYYVKGVDANAGTSVKFTAKADLDKKVTWSEYSDYAKIDKNGKLTISSKAPNGEEIYVYARVMSGDIIVCEDHVVVTVNNPDPPVEYMDVIQIYKSEDDYGYIDEEVYIDVSGVTTSADVPVLTFSIDTDKGNVKGSWKSSKTSVAKVGAPYQDENGVWMVDVKPVFSKGKIATGTTTITASVDGLKKSFKLTFWKPITEMEIVPVSSSVNFEEGRFEHPFTSDGILTHAICATAGQTLSLKVVTNEDVSNKGFQWHAVQRVGSVIRDVKISSSGKLTIPKDIVEKSAIYVSVSANDGSNSTFAFVSVSPKATNVHLRAEFDSWSGLKYVSNTTKEWDVNTDNDYDGNPDMTLQLNALVYPFDASQAVKWSVSDKKIATIDKDSGLLTFTGKKFGKLTVTATAKDGSKVKTSFTLDVIRTVVDMRLPAGMAITSGTKDKTVKLASKLTFDPKPTDKDIVWSMQMASLDENGNFQEDWFGNILTEDVPAEIATLNASTGTLKVKKNLSDYVYLIVTALDEMTWTSTETKITLCPKAMTGIVVKDQNGKTIKSKSTVTVTDGRAFPFTIEAKNNTAKTYYDCVGWQYAFSGDTSNYDVATVGIYDDDTAAVYQQNKAGKVKVTIKALDDSGKSFYFYVNFKNDLPN